MSRQERSSQTADNQPPRHDVIDAEARRFLPRRGSEEPGHGVGNLRRRERPAQRTRSNEKPVGQKEARRLGPRPYCHERSHHCHERYRDDVAQGVAPSRWAYEGIAKQGRQAAPEKTQVYVPGLVLRADDLRMGNWLCRDDGGREALTGLLSPLFVALAGFT